MAAPIIYRSSDPSAPVLDGQAGSLVNVLDGCLVNGYGAKGAAGWAKSFAATNKGVYRPAAGNRFYLDVDDSGPGAGTYKEARVRGYETMSAVATGTGPFPTVAQATNGLFPRKSVAASAVPRAWVLFADDRTFYLMVLTGDTAGFYYCWGFGDFFSLLTGDGYRTMITCKIAENSAVVTGGLAAGSSTSVQAAAPGFYAARIAAGTGTSVPLSKIGLGTFSTASIVVFPSIDGSLYLHRLWVGDTVPVNLRGYLRGVWQVIGDGALFNDGDQFTGSGALSGSTFKIIKSAEAASLLLAVETTAWGASS